MTTLVFFDVDNTLLKGYSGFYTTIFLMKEGVLKKRRILLSLFYRLASPFYKGNVQKMYEVAALDMAGQPLEKILKLGRRCFESSLKPRLYQEGLKIIKGHKKKGHPIYLMTSGPYMAIKILADYLGVDGNYSPGPLVDEKGLLTSKIRLPICYREGKVLAAEEVLKKHGARWEDCYYYADSTDDLPLLQKVGHPHIVNPEKGLLKIGKKKGWPILNFKQLKGDS